MYGMRFFLAGFLLVYFWDTGMPCNTYNTRLWDVIAKVKIHFPVLGHRIHSLRIKRSDVNLKGVTFTGHMKNQCDKLRPGLSQITRGNNLFYFNYNDTDHQRSYSPLFFLTCPTSSRVDEKGFNLPIEVEPVVTERMANYQEWIKTFRGVDDMIFHEADEVGFWPSYSSSIIRKLGTREMSNASETSTTIISYVVQEYRIKLYWNITLLQAPLNSYKQLPSNYTGNEIDYYIFGKEYGFDYYSQAVIGGRLQVMLKYQGAYSMGNNDERTQVAGIGQSVTDYVNIIERTTKRAITGKFILNVGGQIFLNDTIDKWVESLAVDPSIVGGVVLPISYLLDPEEKDKQKSESFRLARDHEKTHQYLKKSLLQLKSSPTNSVFQKYALQVVQDELEVINPNKTVVTAVNNMLADNFHLNKWFLKCKTPSYWKNSVGEYYLDTYIIYLAVGVCVSYEARMDNCDKLSSSLPPDNNCVIGYEAPSCFGVPKQFKGIQIDNIGSEMHRFMSFMICE